MEHKFMELAAAAARESVGFTSPNPAVGAVLVKNNKVIGVGRTRPAGGDHAEVDAIKRAGPNVRGATLYVTLEPCCHTGRTPPCADAVVASGIIRVVYGMNDPNPKVSGRGARHLKKHGVAVEMLPSATELSRRIRRLNQPFFKAITTGVPYVIMKAAVSLDGKIATATGDSKWITGAAARSDSRRERSLADAVVVGAGTVAADDPELAAHGAYRAKPLLRVIIDPKLSSDLKNRVFRDEHVLVATSEAASAARRRAYARRGIPFELFGKSRISIPRLMRYLGERGIRSVYVEGGAGVHGSWHDAALTDKRLIDKIIFYIAPKLIGGEEAVSAVGGRGIRQIASGLKLKETSVIMVGSDIKVTGIINYY